MCRWKVDRATESWFRVPVSERRVRRGRKIRQHLERDSGGCGHVGRSPLSPLTCLERGSDRERKKEIRLNKQLQ